MADIGPRLEAVLSSIATADVRAEVPPIKYAQWLGTLKWPFRSC
jgi:hypothetical protein